MTVETPPRRVAVAGASGRMGRMLVDALATAGDLTLAGALERTGSPAIGEVVARHDGGIVRIVDDIDATLADVDFLIDFTQPAGTLAHLDACVRHRVRHVIGTTGFDDAGRARIAAAAASVPIVFAPNMSTGVNVTLKLIEMATRALADDCDIEVIEAHHRMKVDAPSGTALKIGEVIAAAKGRALSDVGVFARHGHTGARAPGTVGFSVIRGGDIVGDHTVLYAGIGERIEITHRSSSRETYAQGALKACRFLAGKPPGCYDMFDVLGLK
ncbi:MAG: 4-hydroxy-tetrahydrodipicolinate reductase [Lautropia sp.]